MNSASAETCRVLSTSNDEQKTKVCEAFARRRLQAIPQQDNFHLHSQGCSYKIQLNGNCNSTDVEVVILNEVKPLPLIAFLSETFGLLNENKCFLISASSNQKLRPSWTENSPQGNDMEHWVGQWLA